MRVSWGQSLFVLSCVTSVYTRACMSCFESTRDIRATWRLPSMGIHSSTISDSTLLNNSKKSTGGPSRVTALVLAFALPNVDSVPNVDSDQLRPPHALKLAEVVTDNG